MKIKAMPAILAIGAIATSISLSACNDDKPGKEITDPPAPPIITVDDETDRDEAIDTLNKFMASAQEGKNFTAVTESADGQFYSIFADGDKMKTDDCGITITYVVSEADTLYKIYQAEDSSWHKDVAEDGTKDVQATIDQLVAKINVIAWSEYDSETNTLKFEGNNGSATAQLETTGVTLKISNADGRSTCTISDVGTTLVNLPENVIDDTQEPPPPPQLTEEQKQAIMTQNLFNAVEGKIKSKYGEHVTVNKIYAFDYEKAENGSNYVYTLLEYTTQAGFHKIDLLRTPMATELTEENVLDGTINTNQYTSTIMLTTDASMLETENSEKSLSIFEKLKSENLIQTINPDVCFYSTVADGVDSTLHCGTHSVRFYSLNKNQLEFSAYLVKSDGGTLDNISDYLINGTLDETFRKVDSFYHEFTDNVIYNLDGLQYQMQSEEQQI